MPVDMNGALQGIKVLDFSWVAAGPLTSMYLANYGATVIKVEHALRFDPERQVPPLSRGEFNINGSYYFAALNNNKYGITLDLNKPDGLKVAGRLIKWADVIVENYMPGTMERWGLDYGKASKLNPGVIMISLSMQGQTGPHAELPGFGPMLMGLSGMGHLGGWPERPPGCASIPYPDMLSAAAGSFALVSALDYRERTGRGQYIDLSMYEATVGFLGSAILDFTANGRVQGRAGNRLVSSGLPYAAPHGAYPTRGNDRWCAIAVFDEEQWKKLVDLMGRPPWSGDPRFSTHRKRCAHSDELDGYLGEWTAGFEATKLMALLQEHGIAAGVVHDQQGLYEDPQMNFRGHFQHLEHPVMGRYHVELPPAHLSRTPPRMNKASPCLGDDNDYVYRDILGYSQEQYDLLIAKGVVGLAET